MTQEICRILHKTGHDPRDLGSCKILIGKIQEASGMRLGKFQLFEFDISQKFNWYEIREVSPLSDRAAKELGKQEEIDSY